MACRLTVADTSSTPEMRLRHSMDVSCRACRQNHPKRMWIVGAGPAQQEIVFAMSASRKQGRGMKPLARSGKTGARLGCSCLEPFSADNRLPPGHAALHFWHAERGGHALAGDGGLACG
jgi:hypothetical protein